MRRSVLVFVSLMLLAGLALGQSRSRLSSAVREFVKIDAPTVVLNHVRVIDGTGTAPRTDQAIVIEDGKIATIGDSAAVKIPDQAKVVDLSGYSVIPGLVGMHNHLHYTADQSSAPPGRLINQITFSAPRLLSGRGRDDDADCGQYRALCGSEPKAEDRCGAVTRPQDRRHRALSRRAEQFLGADARTERARRRAADGELLGGQRSDFVQGIHEHHARGVARRG